MIDQTINNEVDAAIQHGQRILDQSIGERLEKLDEPSAAYLANYAILGQSLDLNGIKHFFELSEILISAEDLMAWIINCLKLNLLVKIESTENENYFWQIKEEIFTYFLNHSQQEALKKYHLNADRFFQESIALIIEDNGIALPLDETRREIIIGPDGFLFQLAHLPQYQSFHNGLLNMAILWIDHLLWLKEYKDAANILNGICFAMARRGQRKIAENLLALVASKNKGLSAIAAEINLATLLREEHQISKALQLYWRVVPRIVWNRGFFQLAQTLTEIAAIYRQQGKLILSVLFLEFSILLHTCLRTKNRSGIAHSQLASTYRYLKLYPLALRNSQKAVNYFRDSNDLLNLGRSLLTQGNIYYNRLESEQAFKCLNEAREISMNISDSVTEIGAISGKARVFLSLEMADDAQTLLTEAISLRERRNDHNVCVEYQNMGAVYEKKGDYAQALGWYQKALDQFKIYMPVEVPNCQSNIKKVQQKYNAQRRVNTTIN